MLSTEELEEILRIPDPSIEPIIIVYPKYYRELPDYIRYRYDPVPGTGVWHFNCASYKNMKTTQERRINCSEHHKPYTRGKRRNLSESWDDIPKSNLGNNNWKRYRKTQYKTIDPV